MMMVDGDDDEEEDDGDDEDDDDDEEEEDGDDDLKPETGGDGGVLIDVDAQVAKLLVLRGHRLAIQTSSLAREDSLDLKTDSSIYTTIYLWPKVPFWYIQNVLEQAKN